MGFHNYLLTWTQATHFNTVLRVGTLAPWPGRTFENRASRKGWAGKQPKISRPTTLSHRPKLLQCLQGIFEAEQFLPSAVGSTRSPLSLDRTKPWPRSDHSWTCYVSGQSLCLLEILRFPQCLCSLSLLRRADPDGVLKLLLFPVLWLVSAETC